MTEKLDTINTTVTISKNYYIKEVLRAVRRLERDKAKKEAVSAKAQKKRRHTTILEAR